VKKHRGTATISEKKARRRSHISPPFAFGNKVAGGVTAFGGVFERLAATAVGYSARW
jgi:hypothetical protein